MARNWNTLSPTYRNRLVKAGITKAQYQVGAPLSKARGHSQTPEHPSEAHKKPQYARYRARKAKTGIRSSAIQRANDYYNRPERERKKPHWPNDETTEFWKEYQNLRGVR